MIEVMCRVERDACKRRRRPIRIKLQRCMKPFITSMSRFSISRARKFPCGHNHI
jgi:hypothetical protein